VLEGSPELAAGEALATFPVAVLVRA